MNCTSVHPLQLNDDVFSTQIVPRIFGENEPRGSIIWTECEDRWKWFRSGLPQISTGQYDRHRHLPPYLNERNLLQPAYQVAGGNRQDGLYCQDVAAALEDLCNHFMDLKDSSTWGPKGYTMDPKRLLSLEVLEGWSEQCCQG